MIYYCIQVVLYQVLLFGVYEVFLKKETFFRWNRWYLLLLPAVSLLLPLIDIPSLSYTLQQAFTYTLPVLELNSSNQGLESGNFITNLLPTIWLIGSLVSLARFIFRIYQLLSILSCSQRIKKDGFMLISIPRSNQAFSFLNMVFLGEELTESQKATIVAHELVHIREGHSWDLLYFELLKILFWFNPLIYILQKKHALVLEFIADAKVIIHHKRTDYYEHLVAQVFQTTPFKFVNTFFNHSLIKNRIIMLQKTPSKQSGLSKYLIVFPALASLFIVFACAQNNDSTLEEEQKANQVIIEAGSEKAVSFATLESTPVFPGCEGLASEENKQCFTQKVAQFVSQEFNTKVADETVSGSQRIVVHFVINKNGEVEQIQAKAQAESLREEAIRVTNLLPKMRPGEKDGNPVAVQFALPILFEL